MRKIFYFIVIVCVTLSFSLSKTNPFVGNWSYYMELDDENPSATFNFTDTSVVSFVYIFGIELITTGIQPYNYSNDYLIISNREKLDTLLYSFISSDSLITCDLNYKDSLIFIRN